MPSIYLLEKADVTWDVGEINLGVGMQRLVSVGVWVC